MTKRAIILSGAGRYADPWHPFRKTSERLAALVAAEGYDVEVREDIDAALAGLGERDDVDLIVVNAGDPESPVDDGEAAEYAAALDGDVAVDPAPLEAAIERGVGILAMHAAASSLRDYPAFDRALGARWERGVSWHPDFGEAHVHIVGNHAVREGLLDFDVLDERYSGLHLHDVIETIGEHEEGGIRHPIIWAREFGSSRLVYDALGHDTRSYDSDAHRDLLARAIDWLAHEPVRRLTRGGDGDDDPTAAEAEVDPEVDPDADKGAP